MALMKELRMNAQSDHQGRSPERIEKMHKMNAILSVLLATVLAGAGLYMLVTKIWE
jgi:hypothetical protein